ncbi:MFS transporter [Merismopedia glauca CCAP 1448/3]|uniref:MFS transporter n=2 Tax=Merismopedia TaxID=53402 RepID=A0A2T1C7E1_9CYAN|nr:MFS transporter [Merismopedia glauca CCAP 1448/3]
MLGVGLGVLMFTVDTSIVNIALPTLVKEFQTSFATIQWVVLSYLLVVTALVLGAARLGDIFGKKKLYLGGLVLFTISSLLCGLAPNVGWLIAFRALQGVGAVTISGLGAAIITEVFPVSERGRALGIIGAVVSLGIASGPSIGGFLIGLSGWESIFFVNVPLGIFATLVVIFNVPDDAKSGRGQTFDWLGTILITGILIAFALGMTYGQERGFLDPLVVGLQAIALVGLLLFLWLESRISQPLLDLKLFRNQQFSFSLLTGFIVFITIAGTIFVIPFFLELVLHYPTQHVGLLLAVSPVIGGIVAPLSGNLSDRFGTKLVSLIGLILMILGCLSISTFNSHMTDLDYILGVTPFGIGFGMFQSPNNSAILGAVAPQRLGIASGLLSLSRTLGQTAGVPLMGALFAFLTLRHGGDNNVTQASSEALVMGVQGTFQAAAAMLSLAVVVVLIRWRIPQER